MKALLKKAKKYTIKVDKITFVLDSKYTVTNILGKGAYGCVIECFDKEINKKVAIKKIDNIFEHKVYATRCLRELKILRLLKNENIVAIKEILIPEKDDFDDIYVVYEVMETDLGEVIKSDQELDESSIKYFMYQLLKGIKFIHSANIIHRDLKPKNLLVNSDCELKICDFGLAKPLVELYEYQMLYTKYICTRWYRPPEILLGWDEYEKSLDIWSIGCILAELFLRRPLFKGSSSEEQMEIIIDHMGTPLIEEVYKIGCFKGREKIFKMGKREPKDFASIFPKETSSLAIDFMDNCLKFDRDKRFTIEECLEHEYFKDYYKKKDIQETEPINRFDFMFEDDDHEINELRELIIEEIMLYHDIKVFQQYLYDKKYYNEFINEANIIMNRSNISINKSMTTNHKFNKKKKEF